MTSMVGRGVSTTAVIGGGALAVGGITGAVGSTDESRTSDLTVAIAGGIGLAGGATALATTGRVGTVARVVGIGATAIAGVAALVGLVGGTRRQEQPVPEVAAAPTTTPVPSPTTTSPSTPTPSPAPGPAPTPTPTPTDPAPTPTPLTPKQAYEQKVERLRARVDTITVVTDGFVSSDAQLAAIHPQYSQIFRHALNERLPTRIPVTGEVNWTRTAKSIDTDRDGKVTFDERTAGGRTRAHYIAAYSAGVDEKIRADGDFSPAARVRAGEQLLKEWNGPVLPGHSPGDAYGAADTLLRDAGIARQPDDSADWKLVAQHVYAKLTGYGF